MQVLTIRILSLNKPLDAVVVAEVAFEAVVVVRVEVVVVVEVVFEAVCVH